MLSILALIIKQAIPKKIKQIKQTSKTPVNTVKSVLVVKAYIVSANVMPKVNKAASRTVCLSYTEQIILTEYPSNKVKIVRRI